MESHHQFLSKFGSEIKCYVIYNINIPMSMPVGNLELIGILQIYRKAFAAKAEPLSSLLDMLMCVAMNYLCN